MTAQRLHTEYAVRFERLTAEPGPAAPIYVDGIQSVDVSSQLQTRLETGDGRVSPTFGSLVSGEPRARFTTNDLKGLLDLVTNYALIDSDGTHPGVSFYAQAFAKGAARSTALAHEATFGDGIIIVRSINASHRGPATATAEVIGESTDGDTSPVVLDEAATLPAAAAQVASVWTIGKVDLNGTQWEGIESIAIDMGVEEIVESKDSSIFPSFVSVKEWRPRVTLRGSHIDITTYLTEDGLYIPAGVVLYFRKRAEGAKFVADGTAEHIAVTLGKCRVEWRSISGDPKTMEVVLIPWDTEAGTAPMAINTASIIA